MKCNLNNKSVLFIITTTFICFASIKPAEAVTLYFEDFPASDQGKGATGASSGVPSTDLVGVDWTIDVGGASLTATDDWFRVENGAFEGQDLDGPAIWTSGEIPISGYSDVSFSLDFSESNRPDNGLEESFNGGNPNFFDFVDVEYDVDGTKSLIANQNGYPSSPHTLDGDFSFDPEEDPLLAPANQAGTIEQAGISGSNLQIIVTMQNSSADEIIRFDNVLVEAVPFEFSPSLGLFIAGGFGFISHLKKRYKLAQELPKR